MRILEYAVAFVTIGIFSLVLGALAVAALQWFFSETLPTWLGESYFTAQARRGYARGFAAGPHQTTRSGYRPARFAWLEELRAKNHMRKLDRLAATIERKLERRRIGSRWDVGK